MTTSVSVGNLRACRSKSGACHGQPLQWLSRGWTTLNTSSAGLAHGVLIAILGAFC